VVKENMRDCSKCKNSVANRPELENVPFEDTPCSACKPSEPTEGHISFGSQFEHPSDRTWKILDQQESEYRLETFLYWLDAWEGLDEPERKIVSLIVRNAGKTQAELAEMIGVSRQAVHKRIVRLRKRFPSVFV